MADDLGGVRGVESAVAKLLKFPKELTEPRGGVVAKATSKGAKVIQDQAKILAPLGKGTPVPGRLKANVFRKKISQTNQHPKNPTALYQVGVRGGGKYGAGRRKKARTAVLDQGGTVAQAQRAALLDPKDAYYWFFVEFGTSKMAAQPFLRTAAARKARAAVDEFSRSLGPEIEKVEAKLGAQL